jgi:hypothetical protein
LPFDFSTLEAQLTLNEALDNFMVSEGQAQIKVFTLLERLTRAVSTKSDSQHVNFNLLTKKLQKPKSGWG